MSFPETKRIENFTSILCTPLVMLSYGQGDVLPQLSKKENDIYVLFLHFSYFSAGCYHLVA